MNPPPAEGFASRLFLGPALRTQPDRRLVTLVRDGYDTAFEEIVRRYGGALTRYAGAIVGGRSEDVAQDAFSKALLALRRDSDAEIDLKPWLYRIVRNTALNDLRDRPPDAAELDESLASGSPSAAEEAERREEVAELMRRLHDLPEQQRAAIVMRELEGLSHDEIAAALGLSGGGARQAIYRARQALRDGLGLMIPLPLIRTLIEHGTAAEATAGAAAASAGGAAAAAGGAGAGTALKVGLVTAVLAGSVGTGLAVKDNRAQDRNAEAAAAATVPGGEDGSSAGGEEPAGNTPKTASDSGADGEGSSGGGAGGGEPSLDGTRSEVDSGGASQGEPVEVVDGDQGPGGGPGGHPRGPRQPPPQDGGPGRGEGPPGGGQHGQSGPGGGGPGPGGGGSNPPIREGGEGTRGPGGDGSGSPEGGGPGPSQPPQPPPEGSELSGGSGSGPRLPGEGPGPSGPRDGGGELLP